MSSTVMTILILVLAVVGIAVYGNLTATTKQPESLDPFEKALRDAVKDN